MKNDEIRKTELDEANQEQVCGGENPLILVQPLASEYDAVCPPMCLYHTRCFQVLSRLLPGLPCASGGILIDRTRQHSADLCGFFKLTIAGGKKDGTRYEKKDPCTAHASCACLLPDGLPEAAGI